MKIERQLPIDPDLGPCSLLDELDPVLDQEANQLIPCNKVKILPSPTEIVRVTGKATTRDQDCASYILA